MKKFKKLSAAVAATLMAATMVAPVAMNFVSYAADYTLSIPRDKDGKSDFEKLESVTAYQIFDIETSGSGYKVKTNTWNIKMKTCVQSAMTAASESKTDITYATPQDAFDAIVEFDKAAAGNKEKFAKALAKEITEAKGEAAVSGTPLTWTKKSETETADKLTIETALADGYYIVLATAVKQNGEFDDETSSSTDPKDEKTFSLGMLTIIDGTTGDIGVDGVAKVGLPTVQKKVQEDSTISGSIGNCQYETAQEWNDQADLEIGQTANFRLYGTLPENYAAYDKYYYCFTDSLDSQFDAVTLANVDIVVYSNEADAKDKTNGKKVYVDGTNVKVEPTSGSGTTANSFKIEFNDLKTITEVPEGEETTNAAIATDKNSVIIVSYSSKLNAAAKIADGNDAKNNGQDNAVTLTYSRNPNQTGSGTPETEETPEDRVRIFTYDFEVDKTFFEGSTPLTQKEIADETWSDFKFKVNGKQLEESTDSAYDYVITGDTAASGNDTGMTLKVYDTDGTTRLQIYTIDGMKVAKDKETGETVKYTYDEAKKKWYTDGEQDHEVETAGRELKLKIKIKGVDSDTYTVTEDQTSRANDETGKKKYNDTDDIKIKLESKMGSNGDVIIYNQDNTLADKLTVSYSYATGYSSFGTSSQNDKTVDFQNVSGVRLPETGGIGTTLFYLGGGAMVAFAGVALITKKRVGKKEA